MRANHFAGENYSNSYLYAHSRFMHYYAFIRYVLGPFLLAFHSVLLSKLFSFPVLHAIFIWKTVYVCTTRATFRIEKSWPRADKQDLLLLTKPIILSEFCCRICTQTLKCTQGFCLLYKWFSFYFISFQFTDSTRIYFIWSAHAVASSILLSMQYILYSIMLNKFCFR